MNELFLTKEQQAKLHEIWQFAQGTEEKLKKLDKTTEQLSQKWQKRQEVREVMHEK